MNNETVQSLDAALSSCHEDMQMLDVVYRLTYVKVASVCYAVLKDRQEALDSAQDTYIRLMNVSKKYKSGTNPLAFVLKVAVNVARENRRRRYRGGVELNIDEMTLADSGELYGRVYTDWLLSQLDEKKRLIVMLYINSGLTFEEIARVVGQSLNTVRAEYRRAINILKEKSGSDEK